MKHAAIALSVLSVAAVLVACAAKTTVADIDDGDGTSDGGTKKKDSGKSSSGSSGDDTTSSSGSSGTSSSGSSGTSSSGSSGTSSSGSSGGDDTACAGMADFDTCVSCCEDNHKTGSNTFFGTLQACWCKGANCGSDCSATLCASTPANPDATCESCIDGLADDACDADLDANCGSDPDCVAFNTCANACPPPTN